jgi:transglutaminase-like putative cysteine protease
VVSVLNDWVYGHLRKVPTVSLPNAVQVLDMGEGDCNEHAVLFAALARAVGLPARVVAGAVYLDGAFFYHAWCEVWLTRWVSVDPTFHQFPADATHIKFVTGGPDEQLAMMEVVGRLGIEVLDDDHVGTE